MARKFKDEELTADEKQEIKALRAGGVPYSYITDKFHISERTVWLICRPQDSDGSNLGHVVSVLNHIIYRNRPVLPPPESHVLLPLPAWAALQIARALYDQGIISYEGYSTWLDENIPKKEEAKNK